MPSSAPSDLIAPFGVLDVTKRAVDALRSGQHRAVGGLWGASASLFLAAVRRAFDGPLLVVTSDDGDSEDLAADLATFSTTSDVLVSQAFDIDGLPEPTTRGRRARCLTELLGRDDFLLVASLDSLLQEAPNVESLSRGQLRLTIGDRVDQSHLAGMCADAGLRRVPVVLAPGEFSVRGDVVDVFPLAAAEAVRLEFFDEEIESIRTFDPDSQRSLAVLDSCSLVLGESILDPSARECATIRHVHRTRLGVLWYEPLRIEAQRKAHGSLDKAWLSAWAELESTLSRLGQLEFGSLPSQDLDHRILSAGSAVGSGEADPLGRLRSIRGYRGAVQIVCRTPVELGRLRDAFTHKRIDASAEQVSLSVGALSRGFRIDELEITVLSNVEFAGVPAPTRMVEKRAVPSRALQSFFELGPGDLVVHAVHGIALFEAMERVERGESVEDHLRLVFHDDVRLLVPVSKIHLVQKYVGAGEARPKLDKLGGRGFSRRKQEVEEALFDLASDLLDLQARREKVQRDPYPPDDLEEAFLADFPFDDTEDQVTCWAEIAADLTKPHPMDRLLCGDVGFGKTELAMRAAFRVAVTGRQVGVLVPTTVLAEQHRRTF
ncbi:MAG: hypothetical protein KDB80_11995, partial [Planctomycetes bacterium]|nr:hypothetical protein [Planctomycetota bacterium]